MLWIRWKSIFGHVDLPVRLNLFFYRHDEIAAILPSPNLHILKRVSSTMAHTLNGSLFWLGVALLANTLMLATAQDADVLIIGAGASGLSAAQYLKSKGKSVVVLEARSRVGGQCLLTTCVKTLDLVNNVTVIFTLSVSIATFNTPSPSACKISRGSRFKCTALPSGTARGCSIVSGPVDHFESRCFARRCHTDCTHTLIRSVVS